MYLRILCDSGRFFFLLYRSARFVVTLVTLMVHRVVSPVWYDFFVTDLNMYMYLDWICSHLSWILYGVCESHTHLYELTSVADQNIGFTRISWLNRVNCFTSHCTPNVQGHHESLSLSLSLNHDSYSFETWNHPRLLWTLDTLELFSPVDLYIC